MANKGIKWNFNKPRAEEYIKSKRKRLVQYLDLNSDATDEELISDLTGAEKLMFIRASELVKTDINSSSVISVLTTHHLSIGESQAQLLVTQLLVFFVWAS